MFSAGSEGHELMFHGLGSGLVEDENGKPVADDNNQVGSIGLNMINFSARVVDDRAVVTCFVPASYISGFSEDTDMANMKRTVAQVIAGKAKASNSAEDLDYNVYEAPVAGNPSPLAYVDIEVVKAADGDAIASPTVTIKVGSSSGDAVSAGADGLYVLTPGQTYYYSVSKTSYTTQTGTFVYKEGGRFTRTFALAAA